jgi:two-component system, OmpR family, response regulator
MTLRVLCVDDEPDILLVLGIALQHTIGADVAKVGSGADVFPWLEANGPPDAVVLDAMMPVTDGYEVCRRIRADPRYAGVVVVFLTARALVDELDEGAAAGADGVLSKPFDPMTIGPDIRAIVEETRARRAVADG